MNNSIWAEEMELPRFPRLEGDRKTDVLIIGGGLAGLLCAKLLADRGVDHLLIESDRIMHGVSRNTTAKITSQHGLVYHKMLQRFGKDVAYGYWQANEDALASYRILGEGIPCDLEKKDNFIYSPDSKAKLERELSALSRLGIPGDYVPELPIPVKTAGAIRFRNQAQFHPLKFVAGILQGLNIMEQTAAREFAGNTVVTDRGRIRAEKIIVATHFPILNKHGAYFLKLYQQRSYVIGLKPGEDVGGMYLGEGKDGLSFRNQGEYLLLGGGSHRTGTKTEGWAPLKAFAEQHFPGATIRCRWATQDCISLDGIPYIGYYSRKTPNLLVATGFNKWGMTSSMVAGRILCDLVQDRTNPYEEIFTPARTILRPQVAINLLESSVNLLTPTAPRCPHMGCALKWNPQEHSWDCPCHGSRFGEEGQLLDNPATDGLNRDAG